MRPLSIAPLCVALLAACSPTPPAPSRDTGAAAATAPGEFRFAETTIEEQQALMARGELSSRVLVQAYLDRIEQIDRNGPKLNAIIETNPSALAEADALDAERKAGHVRGPLHGIPIVLKDNIDATPMVNSAGSLALAEFRPRTDAAVVTRLRAAGVVVLAKTNLSEWANFRSASSSSGWSGRGGQTRNPYSLDRNPCGSSSGTAAGVSANLATAGVGTETDGSILCPSAVNGLVGLKPTVGLVSRTGIIPISHSQDTAGPMTRTVADAALLLTAMAGRDPLDAATAQRPGQAVYDYRERLQPNALKGARIGVLRAKMKFDPSAAAAVEAALKVMRDAGATIVDAEIPTDGQWAEDELTMLLFEFKADLEAYLQSHNAPVTNLAGIIAFNKAHATEELPFFGQELLEKANATTGLADPIYIAARMRAKRLAGPDGIDAALKAQRLDALVAPTTGPAWRTNHESGDRFAGEGYGAAAVAGYPSLTVPAGYAKGLPLGITFMGTAWSEPTLLRLGYAYEQLTQVRQPPTLRPGAPIL